jgi:hypothetical protein
MGVYVRLEVLPERIPEAAWSAVFDEAVRLARAFPKPLVAFRKEEHEGFERFVLTRRIVDDDGEWLRICGDAETRERAEQFEIPRRRPEVRGPSVPPEVDLLAVDEGSLRTVFDEKTQGHPYHTAIVALATLFESRFPQGALASGDLYRETCEEAVAWANGVLDTPLRLPVCVDPEALCARLRQALPPDQVMERFNDHFRGTQTEQWRAHVAYLSDLQPPEEALVEALYYEDGRVTVGAITAVRSWLDATGDLPTLLRAACQHPAGPHWDLPGLMSVLGQTWVLLAPEDTQKLAEFQAQGGIGVMLGFFGAFYPELHLDTMLSGYRPGLAEVVETVADVLEWPREEVQAEAEAALARERQRLKEMEANAEQELEKARAEKGSEEPNWPELTASVQRHLPFMRQGFADLGHPVTPEMLHRLVTAMASHVNLVLHEETWARLDEETNADALLVVLLLMRGALPPSGQRKYLETLLETGVYRRLAGEGAGAK